jgi:predicted restriction endonuclease
MDELAFEQASSGEFDPVNVEDARERTLRAIVARRGQPQFRKKLLLAYGEKCAITGFDCPSALEAAHITPYMGEHTNAVSNGLLLRSDIHTLFDCGELSIDSKDMTVVISHGLANSRYNVLAGSEVRLPPLAVDCPSMAALDKHREETGL